MQASLLLLIGQTNYTRRTSLERTCRSNCVCLRVSSGQTVGKVQEIGGQTWRWGWVQEGGLAEKEPCRWSRLMGLGLYRHHVRGETRFQAKNEVMEERQEWDQGKNNNGATIICNIPSDLDLKIRVCRNSEKASSALTMLFVCSVKVQRSIECWSQIQTPLQRPMGTSGGTREQRRARTR